MLFNSFEFIFAFLPITFFVYFYLNKKRLSQASKLFLVCSSLFFYSWWNIVYLPLILSSMIFNYLVGSWLAKKGQQQGIAQGFRKQILIIGIVSNIALLAYFKYSDFFIENINAIFDSSFALLNLALPLAISFFTFQQIAYLVDSYRNETHEYNFLNYAIFITFFPQLIAGPIVHHKEMMPQFAYAKNRVLNHKNIVLGLLIFSMGLFKKVAIADTFAIWANSGFDSQSTLSFFEAWATSLSYTFQLYFDFSGYCDMAMGAALLFNIRLPLNFNSPYKSLDIQDFWRRWHITLGRFLRDYVYIPLGGSKTTDIRTYTNLFITFLIGGFWHGASWMFVIWGAMHGAALVVHRIWKSLGGNLPTFLAWLLTFSFINISWVFFRAEDVQSATAIISSMFGGGQINYALAGLSTQQLSWLGVNADLILTVLPNGVVPQLLPLLMICLSFFLLSCRNSFEISHSEISMNKVLSIASLSVLAIYVMAVSSSAVFLYFNF